MPSAVLLRDLSDQSLLDGLQAEAVVRRCIGQVANQLLCQAEWQAARNVEHIGQKSNFAGNDADVLDLCKLCKDGVPIASLRAPP